MNKSIFITVFALSGLAFIATSCGGKNETTTDASDEFAAAEKELDSGLEKNLYELPSPSEIPGLLERTGVDFNGGLLNNEDRVDSYLSASDKAALNLGIYSTDVGYLIAYEKVQDALNYMGTSRKLAENLGLTGTFESSIIKRFEENLGDRDSLTILLDQTIGASSDYLQQDDRAKTAALLMTGALVEGLHISSQLIATYPTDLPAETRDLVLTDLIKITLEQGNSIEQASRWLTELDQTDAISSISKQVAALSAKYEEINVDELIKNNEGGVILSADLLTDIIPMVKALRTEIIE